MPKVECAQCGVSCHKAPSKVRRKNFCGNVCAFAWKLDNTKPCHQCGKPMPLEGRVRRREMWFCDRVCADMSRAGKITNGADGYLNIWTGVKYVRHHRYVMEQHLERPLTADETVHHKNLNRKDNRLSNLELWSGKQPSGARVTDLLAYAHEIIEMYGELEDRT